MLNQDHTSNLNTPITPKNIEADIKSTKEKKSPGLGDFSADSIRSSILLKQKVHYLIIFMKPQL